MKQAKHNPQSRIIIPTGQTTGYIEAFNAARGKGGLPSNVMYDDLLRSAKNANIALLYCKSWTKEILVYPESNGEFIKGKDVVDTAEDSAGRVWIFPSSSIPEEAFGKKGVGLFIDPQSIRIDGNRVIIEANPSSITILGSFLQEAAQIGEIDEKTRMPLKISFKTNPQAQFAILLRKKGPGVRPISRYNAFLFSADMLIIDAGSDQAKPLAVNFSGLPHSTQKAINEGKKALKLLKRSNKGAQNQ